MCTFLSSLPKHSISNGTGIKKNLVLSLRPCKDPSPTEKVWYRFRLLNFSAPGKSTRDFPFIERYVHQVWGKNDKGWTVLKDEVVCPVTRWSEFEGNRYEGCPICRIANQYFVAWKESNWKDRDAASRNKEIGRKYQAIIPVYVINDPNYPANNHKFKVIILNDKEEYKKFCDIVSKESIKHCVFNNKNAVDCCVHVSDVEKIANEGKPNEYTWHQKEIDKIVFSNKPHDIDSITKDTVDNMGFDDTYYVSSTLDELNAFYNKYIKVSNDDIPDDDTGSDVFEETPVQKPEKKIAKTNKVEVTKVENTEIETTEFNDLAEDSENLDIDDLIDSSDNEEVEKPETKEEKTDDSDDFDLDDDLLKDLGID